MEQAKLRSPEAEFNDELIQTISRGVSKEGISEGYILGIVITLLEQRQIYLMEKARGR